MWHSHFGLRSRSNIDLPNLYLVSTQYVCIPRNDFWRQMATCYRSVFNQDKYMGKILTSRSLSAISVPLMAATLYLQQPLKADCYLAGVTMNAGLTVSSLRVKIYFKKISINYFGICISSALKKLCWILLLVVGPVNNYTEVKKKCFMFSKSYCKLVTGALYFIAKL